MAATGFTPIYLYYSSTATNVPSAGSLGYGELAINITDKNLFFKDNTNAVNTVPIRQSSASSNGWLSSTDWSTFNGKQPAGSYAVTNATNTFTADQQINGYLSLNAAPSAYWPLYVTKSLATYNIAFLENTSTTGNGLLIRAGNTTQYALDVQTYNGGAYLLRVRADGNTYQYGSNFNLVDGNVAINTSGKGIDFSATPGTGTSELLADYEEGEWTPTLVASGATFSYGANYGIYTKVGRQVTATFRFYVSASGTVTNPINIAGLPFTSSSTYGMTYGGYVVFANTTITPLIQVPPSDTNAYLTVEATAADATPSSLGMSGVNKWLNGVIVYFV